VTGNKKRNTVLWLLTVVAVLAAVALLFKTSIQRSITPLKVQNIVLVKLPANRLRFQANVSTTTPCDAVLQYWTKGGDTMYSAVSKAAKTHALFITATRGRTQYHMRVKLKKENQRAESKIYPFATEAIYQATPYFTLEQYDSSLHEDLKNKFFLTQILTEPGSVVIIDDKGEIVWYEAFQKGVKVSHWTKDRTILCIVGPEKISSSGGDEIIELGLDGKVLKHLQKGRELDKLVHHEVRKDSLGNIYALTFTEKLFDLTTAGGAKRDTVHGDGIVLLNKAGKKLWEWSVLDHLNPLTDPKILKTKKDWVHGNAAFRLGNGNFLMSFRDLDQVWNIEYPSGKVLWKLGEKGDFKLKPEAVFSAQHYAHLVADGALMMLDNGEKHHISRALIFNLDTLHKTADAITTVPLPAEYYTTAKGSAALFGKKRDNILFCLTDPRAFLITDFKGAIRWKVQVAGDPYRLEELSDFLNPNPGF